MINNKIKNSFLKIYKFIFISYKIILNNIYIFYYGHVINNFILFDIDLRAIKKKIKIKYNKFIIIYFLSRILKRIGFLFKFSSKLILLKK